jgi:hypothetical protein
MGVNVVRWAGDNRFETAATIAGVMAKVGPPYDEIVLVNGNGFADALAAGPIASSNNGVILLTNATSIPAATAATHVASCAILTGEPQVSAVGGTAVVSDAVLAGADGAATCVAPAMSATLTTVSETSHVLELTNDGCGGGGTCTVATGDGVKLVAKADSAASGASGTDWNITFMDSGATLGVPNPSSATSNLSTTTLTVKLKNFNTLGISQADLVDFWNSNPATKALFVASVNGSTGAPKAYEAAQTINAEDTTVVGKTTQQIVVTFNQDVDDCDAKPDDDVLDSNDFTFPNGNTAATQSPLANTAGGADVYTFNFVLTDSTKVMVGGATGDTLTVTNVCSVANDLDETDMAAATVKFG